MNRREFLKSALFTTIGAVVLSACKKVATTTKSLADKVATRTFLKGKKEEISLLGFGAMRLPIINDKETDIDYKKVEEMVAYAMEHGINYYDTAYIYHYGESEKVMGKVLNKYPRDSFYLATKMPVGMLQNKEQVEQIFDTMLEDLRKRLATKSLGLKITPAVKSWLIKQGYDPKNGARPLRRAIEDHLETLISDAIIKGELEKGDIASVDITKAGEFKLKVGKE